MQSSPPAGLEEPARFYGRCWVGAAADFGVAALYQHEDRQHSPIAGLEACANRTQLLWLQDPKMLCYLPCLSPLLCFPQMRAPYSLSCLFLLTLGACFPPGEQQEPQHPAEGPALKPSCRDVVAEDPGPCWWANPKRRRSEELSTLLGIARELQGYGSQRGGPRGRPGRQEGPAPLPAGGEKRGGTLGNLAEELNGYSRKKGGFTFRFGR